MTARMTTGGIFIFYLGKRKDIRPEETPATEEEHSDSKINSVDKKENTSTEISISPLPPPVTGEIIPSLKVVHQKKGINIYNIEKTNKVFSDEFCDELLKPKEIIPPVPLSPKKRKSEEIEKEKTKVKKFKCIIIIIFSSSSKTL